MYTLEQIIDLRRRYGIQHRVGIRGEFAFFEGVLIFIAMLIIGVWWNFISKKLPYVVQYIVAAIPVAIMAFVFTFVTKYTAAIVGFFIVSVVAMLIHEIVLTTKGKLQERRFWVHPVPDFMVVCSIATLVVELYLLVKF